jgi:hypothetical protein
MRYAEKVVYLCVPDSDQQRGAIPCEKIHSIDTCPFKEASEHMGLVRIRRPLRCVYATPRFVSRYAEKRRHEVSNKVRVRISPGAESRSNGLQGGRSEKC